MISAHPVEEANALTSSGAAVNLLLLFAIVILLAQIAAWLAWVCLRYDHREWMVRLFDSESYPSGSIWQALGNEMLVRLSPARHHPFARLDAIRSPGCDYRLTAPLAVGDLCDVYHAISHDRPLVVKVPRVSGCDHLLIKEQRILRELADRSGGNPYHRYFPAPSEWFRSGDRVISVIDYRQGYFTAGEIRQRYPAGVDACHLAWMFNRTLEALGFAHRAGWIHGAVLPPHLLFHPESHGLQIIGWTHSERLGRPLRIASRKFKAWYPAECHRRLAATPATDIFLAAKTILWLAGGNPVSDKLPDQLPSSIRGLLRDCLAASPSHRPDDAWALHEQFRELWEDLFGPPKFCHLNMS